MPGVCNGQACSDLQPPFSLATDCSIHPSWKRLLEDPLTTHERISLITTIFSDHGGAGGAGYLSGDDAQTFVDALDDSEVGFCTRPPPNTCESSFT